MSLDTLANVKTRLGITTSADDALLNLIRDSADGYIVNYCRRDFTAGPFTEYHSGDQVALRLRNYPVISVTSVKVDRAGGFGAETLVSATSYVVVPDLGIIFSRFGPLVALAPWITIPDFGARAPYAVQVVYTASASIPNDLKHAYADLVGHWYRHVKTMVASEWQNVTQQTFGDATAIFSKDQINGLPVPPDVARILATYRDVAV